MGDLVKRFTRDKNVEAVASFLDDDKLEKLLEAWSWDWPDTKACQHAGISITTLQRAYAQDPSKKTLRDLVRKSPHLHAKRNIAQSLDEGDVRVSQWYLEKKDHEFSTKQQVNVDVSHSITESEVLTELAAFIRRNSLTLSQDDEVIDVTPATLPEPVDVDALLS